MQLFFLAVGDRVRASSRLRLWDHVDSFRNPGDTVIADFVVPSSETRLSLRLMFRIFLKLPGWVAAFFRADAIYIQESLILAWLLPARNLFKRRLVVFDFSDPIDMIGSGLSNRLRRAAFRRMTRLADHIVFENGAYFADFHDRFSSVSQFCGPVDARRYAEARKVARGISQHQRSGPLVLGWTGSPSTLNLIEPLFPLLDQIARVRSISLVLIGVSQTRFRFEHLAVNAMLWSEDSEFATVPLFDLGLFGLDDSKKSQRRGAGKLFIYMAAGVPFIAPCRGIAGDLMQLTGVGFGVRDEAEWERCLLQAIDDNVERQRCSTEGMRIAEDQYSYEKFRSELGRQLRVG